MSFRELAESRYSCRQFSDRKVESALVDQIIETGLVAPTAVNKQPYRIFRMESSEAKAAIRQVTPYTFGTDTFLVVGYQEGPGWVRASDQRPFADVDASIVATHMMLEIKDLGLDTTWVGSFDAPLLKRLCPAMADYELIAIFPIGYAAADARPSHFHGDRKSKAELVAVL